MTPRAPHHFDPAWYLASYPDVARAGMDPLRHYLRYGRLEGRLPCFLVAATRERDLRMGLLAQGTDAFAGLLQGPDQAERAWAAIACARHAAAAGDWPAAAGWLAPLDDARDLIGGFALPDPPLLAIEAAVMTGDLPRARHLLGLARRARVAGSDLALAAANIAAAGAGHGWQWRLALARILTPAGLAVPRVTPGSRPAFDRLAARAGRAWRDGPIVSVIVPARDAAATIATTLRSLSAQSWSALEILVVDNGSADGTAGVVRAHAARDPRIRLIDGAAEPGAYAARNLGLAEARGDFITVADADDWVHPARIAAQVRALLRAPGRAASVSHWVRTTPDLRFTRWWGEAGLVHRNISSLMIRRDLRDRLGYWDRVRTSADTEYYLRIEAICGPDAIAQVRPGLPLGFGRVSPGSLTGSAETGIRTQYYGPRRSYALAARRWHARLDGDGRDLPLPARPARRPFAVPPELAVGDPPADPTAADRLAASDLFDARWYMATHADLRARDARDGVEEIAHYIAHGAAEGRDPGPRFSSSGYALGRDMRGRTPLADYLERGRAAGAAALPDLDGALPAPAPGRHVLFFGHQAGARLFGAERSLLDMLDRARAAGVTPSVVLPHILNADYLQALRARSHMVHVRPYAWAYGVGAPPAKTVAVLEALIRDTAAAEVHVNTAVLAAPLLAARAAGVPATVHVRERPETDAELCFGQGVTAWEWRDLLLARADRFVANSQGVADWLAVPGRTMVVPNRVDPALFELAFAPQDPPRVALIGSLNARKGLGDMIAVARAAGAAGVAAEFVLVGPGGPELEAEGALPGNLRHAGYAPDPVAALQRADIVLNLSGVAESFGRTVLEAMAAGRPVICYDRGHPPELVGDTAGHVVPPGDTGAVVAALGTMLAPDRLAALSQAARTRARALQAAGDAVDGPALFPRALARRNTP